MKKIWFVPVVSMLAFAACSSESSSEPDFGGSGKLNGFIPSTINAYEIDNNMNVIKIIDPVCKEEKRELVWAKAGSDTSEYDYKYDSDKGIVYLGEEKLQFDYLGSKFPEGAWRMSSTDNDDGTFITQGVVFESGKVESGVAYSGNCYLKDVLASEFIGDDEDDDDSEMSVIMKHVTIDCDKITIGDSVVIKMGSWSRDGIETKYTFGKESCSNKVSYRYAYNESDCKAAYEEFKEADGDEFDFDEYSTVNSNKECYDSASEYLMKYIALLMAQDAVNGLGDLLGGSKSTAAKLAKSLTSLKVAK